MGNYQKWIGKFMVILESFHGNSCKKGNALLGAAFAIDGR